MVSPVVSEISPSVAESPRSAASWPAIVAGALIAIAASIVLLALGAGLGFAVASPWPGSGPSVAAFAIGTGIWLIVTQWVASAVGGYVTGRLRTRWTGVHTDEVFFRDTAHGLLAWALATVIIAAVTLGAAASATGTAVSVASSSASYAADTLLRSPRADASGAVRAEVGRILARGAKIDSTDRDYLASLVAARTGVSPREAQARVETAVTSAREAADTARKTSSATAFFTALSMLIGAFIASVAAALGGRLRDEHL